MPEYVHVRVLRSVFKILMVVRVCECRLGAVCTRLRLRLRLKIRLIFV